MSDSGNPMDLNIYEFGKVILNLLFWVLIELATDKTCKQSVTARNTVRIVFIVIIIIIVIPYGVDYIYPYSRLADIVKTIFTMTLFMAYLYLLDKIYQFIKVFDIRSINCKPRHYSIKYILLLMFWVQFIYMFLIKHIINEPFEKE